MGIRFWVKNRDFPALPALMLSGFAIEILETREKTKPHIWTFRTKGEASAHWKELYGHLEEEE